MCNEIGFCAAVKSGGACPKEEAESITVEASGSAVVVALESVWNKIRKDVPELPAVVMVTGSGMIGLARWGHFRKGGWIDRGDHGVASNLRVGEVFIAGETLARGAQHVLGTMLHEAAHVLAAVRDIQDTSRQNRWHNQRFRALAEELGMEYPRETADPKIGFSEVVLTPGTVDQYADVVEELDRALRLVVELPAFLRAALDADRDQADQAGGVVGTGENMGHHGRRTRSEPGTPSMSSNLKAVCKCDTPRIIRASRKVLESDPIMCGKCMAEFLPCD